MTDSAATPTFNLVERPWIPVVDAATGQEQLASLRQLLTSPRAYRGLAVTQPTEFLALHRLFLAFCHRAIGPGTTAQRSDLIDTWPAAAIGDYLDRWQARCDLYDPVRPFMQVPAIGQADLLDVKPWTQLALDRSSGNTKLLFDHSLDNAPQAQTPAAMARTLMAHLQFTPGGLVKALRTSGTRGAACSLQVLLPMGADLQESLALGLVPQTASEYRDDLPPWESDAPSIETLRAPPEQVAAGPAQRYTWLSRAVLLRPEADGSLRWTLYAEGLPLRNGPVPDPMCALVPAGKDGTPRSLTLTQDRAFWRDFHALTGERSAQPPRAIAHAVTVRNLRDDFRPIELAAGGLLPDPKNQAKILWWRLEERRVLPTILKHGAATASAIDAVIGMAERVGQSLHDATQDLCSRWLTLDSNRPVERDDVTAMMEQMGGLSRYWADLETRFWPLVDRLGQGATPDQCLDQWMQQLRECAAQFWSVTTQLLGADGRALAAQAQAQGLFRHALSKAKKG